MSAVTTFPAGAPDEALARTIAQLLEGSDALEGIFGTSPTTFTEAVDKVAFRLIAEIWGEGSEVSRWITTEAWGINDDETAAAAL